MPYPQKNTWRPVVGVAESGGISASPSLWANRDRSRYIIFISPMTDWMKNRVYINGRTFPLRKETFHGRQIHCRQKEPSPLHSIRIPGKDADSVLNAMQSLREEFGDKFSQVFKTITVDNGSEFSAFSQVENWGCAVYFAHPYTSWERPQNERHNGLFRAFVPKGASIEAFSAEYILAAADELNGRPRKKLGYRTSEELFDEFLDSVYAAEGCGSIAQDGSHWLPS
jgi:hypothetical protein